MTDIKNKSLDELHQLIADAQAQLKIVQRSKQKEVIAKIKELAESIGVTVEIHEDSKDSSAKVPAKYLHPDDYSKTWSGRGMTPKWLKTLVDSGHSKEEFLIKD